jgi:DNA-binding beta-propeller fold protein YncE
MKTLNLVDRAVRGGWRMAAVPLALALLLAFHPAHAQRMPQDSWYLAKEMKRFVEPGKFHNPHDAALGPDGNLYVADRYNHRVQVFDQEGNFIRQFGNYGSGNGEFNESTGLHVAPDGKVYVSDWGNARVQVFTAQGKFIRSMGQPGSGEGQLSGPNGVTMDNDGNVYVVEHYNHRVSVFRPDGTYLRQWGSSGTADAQFQGAIAICRTPDNKIAVLERDGTNRRIQVFEPTGTFIRKFTTEWSPHGIECDSVGNFYVTARDWAGFSVFSSNGTRTAVRGHNGAGSGNGQFNPYGLAVGNGKVFACDWNNHRIAVFSTNGTWIKNFGTHQSAEQDTHGIAVDANGNIFISYHQANVIYKFSPELNFIKSFGSAGSGDGQFNGVLEMAIGPNQRLYVVDHSGHRVQYFDLNGNFLGKFGGEGTTNGKFKYPWGIAVGKDNKVYVADRDNHRIQIFDADGNYLSKFGTQGSFDGQFQSPMGLAISPDGGLLVADSVNNRLQKLNSVGEFQAKISSPWNYNVTEGYGSRAERLNVASDGLIFLSARENTWQTHKIAVFSPSLQLLKTWDASWSPMAETKSGDLIAAHGDRVVRVWKRTFRTVHPEPANALPLPTIVSQKRRPGTALVDVDYTVKDADNVTLQTAALAFKNGGNSLADVIPITSFAEGTGNKLGANIATGQTQRFTWDVARDWSTDFGEVQLEILAKDGRGLLNLDFLQIPAAGNQTALKISRSPLTDNDFLSVWYWLIATGDAGVLLENGQLYKSVENYEEGLWGEYYGGAYFDDFRFSRGGDVPFVGASYYDFEGSYSIRWIGYFYPQKTGEYSFRFSADDVASVWVGGSRVATDNASTQFSVSAQAGVRIPIRIDWDNRDYYRHAFSLYLTPPSEPERSVVKSDFQWSAPLASGTSTSASGRAYLFQKMGLREASAAEVTRAKEAGTPGVINQWDPKLRVGPDERPAKINAYGFDTGADGYWVVPVSGN